MSEVKHRRRAAHRVRQGCRPPASAGPTRSRPSSTATAPTRHITLPGHELMLALKHAPTPCSARDRRRQPAGAAQGRAARPDQGHHRARRPGHRPARREGHRRGPAARRRRGRPATACSTSELNTLSRRGRGHRTSRVVEVSVEGLEVGAADPRRRPRAAGGHHAGRRRRRARRPRLAAPTAEQLEAELARPRPSVGERRAEAEERRRGARAATVPPSRRRRPARGCRAAETLTRRPTTPGSSSGWATRARRTPATGTTSASWSSTCSPAASAASSRPHRSRARRRRGAARPAGGRPGAASCWPSPSRT